MKQKYKSKIKNKKHTCIICNKEFYNSDHRGKYCYECKKEEIISCRCGCDKKVKISKCKKASNSSAYGYYRNHWKKGKTYKEIYGTSTPACGFKKGDLNVAKREDIRKKISIKIAELYQEGCRCGWPKKYKNKIGELYRSDLEVKFSNLLIDNKISYVYEKRVKLNNDRIKLVDFFVDDFIMIEISGFAFDSWKNSFRNSMRLLQDSEEYPLVLISYKENMDEIWKIIKRENVYCKSIDNSESIIKCINFCKSIKKFNEQYTERMH